MVTSSSALDRLFHPSSVAVIGASSSPKKFGFVITEMLLRHGYQGSVYPINPSLDRLCGLPVYSSLADIPGPVDVAAICLPAESVLEAFSECVAKQVGGVVIISSGFGETNVGVDLQDELIRLSRQSGVRIIGPNCEGFVCFRDKLALTFSMMFESLSRSGPVAYVSQSGAYTGIIYRRVAGNGLGFNTVVSSGNEADLTSLDLYEYFATDPETSVIVGYQEQIKQSRTFLERMRRITRDKAVVINKVGWTSPGQKAAQSHTGALAATDRVIDAVFRQSGVVRARHVDELVDMTLALGSQPLLRGNRVAILSTAGGLAVETADHLVMSGLDIPALEEDTVAKLGKIVPYYGSPDNPVDLTSSVLRNPEWPAQCIRLAARDNNVDSAIVLLTAMKDETAAQYVLEAIRESPKPVFLCWTAGDVAGDALSYLRDNGLPVYPSPLRAINGFRALMSRGKYVLRDDFVLGQARKG